MESNSSYLLVVHGSRDSQYQIELENLAKLVTQQIKIEKLNNRINQAYQKSKSIESEVEKVKSIAICDRDVSTLLVDTASLELGQQSLQQKIEEFAEKAQTIGSTNLKIVPLFLLPGVHVKKDIPIEIDRARQVIAQEIKLDLLPYLGSHPGFNDFLKQKFEELEGEGRILLSHGSRLLDANHSIERLASELNAVAAYWSVTPNLESIIECLVNSGSRSIAILPYFLFSGRITKAIEAIVRQQQQVFPQVQFVLGKPLGASAEFADLILNRTIQ